jgi:hypothetical protein
MKAFVVAISGVFLATAAFAQEAGDETSATSSEAVSSTASDQREEAGSDTGQAAPRQICRRMETATGSRMSYRRMCMTAEQWRSFNRSGR